MDASDKTVLADDKTVLAPGKSAEARICPACRTNNPLPELQVHDYRCSGCRLELAHLDYAPNGTIRGIFGWLANVGDVVLDRYQIKAVLGKGGFGAAYLADDLQLSGKRRALKEVPEPMFDEYETSLLSKLDHPAIPDIIDRRNVNGMIYLVLKFGGSRTLGDERKQAPDRRIPKEKLFPWMLQLCDVLIYLHGQNPPIIHRDLKPDNILLNEDDRIMLIDFGIAKEAAADGRTRTLAMAVTVGFSPPEQVMGTGTDARADIYALGATFYALLTGKNPTPAHQRIAGVELIPPSQLVPDVPLEVDEAIVKSLSLNMNHRQQSVKEFAAALTGFESAEFSRPTWSEESSQRTQVLNRSGDSDSKRTGLKIPTGPATNTTGQPASIRIPKTQSQHKLILPLIGICILLAALVTGAYFFFKNTPDSEQSSQGQPEQEPTGTLPAVQPSLPETPDTITPPVVSPVPEPTLTNPQFSAPPPAYSTSINKPAAETGSAQEILKNRIAEPEPTPISAPEPEPVIQQAKPQPKPKPKPRPKPQLSSPAPSRSAPAAGSQPSWVIIPGGARKTD